MSLDDDVLRQKVAQLRYNIRSFTLSHFDGTKAASAKRVEESWKRISNVVNVDLQKFEALLKSPKTRIMLMQSAAWGDIIVIVFDRFRWADEGFRDGLIAMREKFSRFRPGDGALVLYRRLPCIFFKVIQVMLA